MQKSEKNEDPLKREIEEWNCAIKNEAVLKKMKLKEEEWMRKENECKEKLERTEKALPVKTIQLIDHLRMGLLIRLKSLCSVDLRADIQANHSMSKVRIRNAHLGI